MPTSRERADAFLRISHQFHLGQLPTEAQHPLTMQLSELARTDLPAAIRLFVDVERSALGCLSQSDNLARLEALASRVREVWARGRRVYLCGCGATGRLSLALETLWRESGTQPHEGVFSFMAGGDYALIRSIENFEDHPEYGAQQLRDSGFRDGDLLIASSEGGETPFVIGAAEEAAVVSSEPPWFLFCNPIDLLKRTTERSRRILENPRMMSLALETGPMAVAGSTRLQASTVLMLAIGSCLALASGDLKTWLAIEAGTPIRAGAKPLDFLAHAFSAFHNRLKQIDFTRLAPLIVREADVYARQGRCVHQTSSYGISVLTDTTERSPTFSLAPFDNTRDAGSPLAWTYLHLKGTASAADAWKVILHREPRTLEWPELGGKYDRHVLEGFDFSDHAQAPFRTRFHREIVADQRFVYSADREGDATVLSIGRNLHERWTRPSSLLHEHLLVKFALNLSSTLVMARLGRVRGNLMIYVKPSNNKLIDRAARVIAQLFALEKKAPPSYSDIVHALFETMESEQAQDVVPMTFARLQAHTT